MSRVERLLEVVGALIAPSSLVVLDEPTAGLDADRRESLRELVVSRSVSLPILVATQDLEWADRVANRVIWLGPEGVPEPPNLSRKRD